MRLHDSDDPLDATAEFLEKATNGEVRATVMAALQARIRSWNVPQAVAASRLGIHRCRLNNLLQSRPGKFSLDALVDLIVASGLTIEVTIHEAGHEAGKSSLAVAAPESLNLDDLQ